MTIDMAINMAINMVGDSHLSCVALRCVALSCLLFLGWLQ